MISTDSPLSACGSFNIFMFPVSKPSAKLKAGSPSAFPAAMCYTAEVVSSPLIAPITLSPYLDTRLIPYVGIGAWNLNKRIAPAEEMRHGLEKTF